MSDPHNPHGLPEAPKAWMCQECDSRIDGDLLEAPHPFITDAKVYGCPVCKSIECLVAACTVEGCTSPVSSGVPGALGYRYSWLCFQHYHEHSNSNTDTSR